MVIGRSNGLASPETGYSSAEPPQTNAPAAVTSCISATKLQDVYVYTNTGAQACSNCGRKFLYICQGRRPTYAACCR
jgi:hypothetical protein